MTTNLLEKALETNSEQFIDELMSARPRHMVPELNDTVCEYPDNHFRLVLDAVGLSYEDAVSRKRNHQVVLKRFACFAYLSGINYSTITGIGRMFNRDHATVLYGIKQLKALADTGYTPCVQLQEKVQQLIKRHENAKKV